MSFLACLGTEVGCCIGKGLCSCCFQICGIGSSSLATRIKYASLLLLTALLAWISTTTFITELLEKYTFNYLRIICNEGNCFGILAVYRICFTNASFHLILSITTYNVNTSKEFRAKFQNSFWNLKLIAWTLTLVTSFFIPNGFFIFLSNYLYFPGAAVFIIIQIVILIDFAYSLSEYLLGLWEDTYDNRYLTLLMSVTAISYIASITITVFLYLWFGGDECIRNQTFISVNIVLCLIATLVSISPRIQEYNPKSGLTQAATVTLYSTYLITSAIMSTPLSQGDSCNLESVVGKSERTSVVIGAFFTFLALAYSTTRAASNSNLLSTQPNSIALPITDTPVEKNQELNDDEEDVVQYSYSLFHIIFCLASMYLAMILSNWNSVTSGAGDNTGMIGKSMAAVWVKVVSSWIVFVLYCWTLLAPLIFPDREFY